MSYDIYIGNAELDSDWPGEGGQPYAAWVVNGHAEPNAPVFPFDEMTGNGNCRSPGYSQWGDFCRAAGLYDLFLQQYDGLIYRHPGCRVLEPHHLATVRAMRERWTAQHPDAVPGFDCDPLWTKKADDGVRGRDPILARLLWLEWWMNWALTHCERPAIYNR